MDVKHNIDVALYEIEFDTTLFPLGEIYLALIVFGTPRGPQNRLTMNTEPPICLESPVDGPEVMSNCDEEVAGLPHMEECQKSRSPSLNQDAQDADKYQDEDLLIEDDIYCCCLLKTLCHTSTPATIGLYSPYKTHTHYLMKQIAGLMREVSRERQKSRLRRGMSYLSLLWYIMFYTPVVSKVQPLRKIIKFLYIKFSAWEHACSNQLWAGLVTTLCDHIRHHFGPLPLSLYYVVGSRRQFASESTQDKWRLKRKMCCITGGLVMITLLAGAGLAAAAFLVPGIRDGTLLKYLGSGIAAILGSGLVIAIAPVIKHLIISQKKKIESMTRDEKFTSQLGFMSTVKSEIEVLTSFIYYMEIFKDRRLRVVFEITGLDICHPEQVVGVLNAINILLSYRDAPFIFILAVDPCVLVSCMEQASSMKGMVDNGYLYLNRTVTLPFSIPGITINSKLHSLKKILKKHEALLNNMDPGMNDEEVWYMAKEVESQGGAVINAVEKIQEAFHCLHNKENCLYRYVPDVIIQMRRIVNTIPIMIRLMTQQPKVRCNLRLCEVAGWVMLANQWPCRLSWILHCMEEKLQDHPPDDYEKKLMWDVFEETSHELFSKHKELQNIMALDGDPKLFEKFLSKDFRFTVQEGKEFQKHTVNLDHSIRYKMGQLKALEKYSKSGTKSEEKA
ncbi:NTPase KAP family P-loop domain-containing protein 1-like [Thamnophis elegans]|uniref:NTPase KAP family P-loop domain-containing protein 1-like n=1 Tax=Thamnophis elegans TaxID=35005 RepID=UPI0013784848|nr:NTPase KAP family P-loop domain-containing protein 1-like [Thamnophis elegans]